MSNWTRIFVGTSFQCHKPGFRLGHSPSVLNGPGFMIETSFQYHEIGFKLGPSSSVSKYLEPGFRLGTS
jgi:hypothetical protein